MRYTIEFVDDLMCVVDEDGNGHDAAILHPETPRAARRQLTAWALQYPLDLPRHRRRLGRQLQSMESFDRG